VDGAMRVKAEDEDKEEEEENGVPAHRMDER
jgi:hypothetical protein